MPAACYRMTGNIVAKTPLHIGSGKRTGIIKQTLPFIPGSFIRGAFGVLIIKLKCRKDKPLKEHENCEYFDECEYASLYGEEFGKSSRIFFRYAYPRHLTCNDGLYLHAPKTMFICQNPQCRKIYDRIKPPLECEVQTCGKSLEPVRGFVCTNCGDRVEVPVSTLRVTMTAIDREIGSVAHVPLPEGKAGTLHAFDVIDEGTRFSFEAIVDTKASEHLKLVENVLHRGLPEEGIGGSKSRGLGKLSFENIDVKEVSTQMLESRAEEIDTSKFDVRLLSPMILGDSKILDDSVLREGARRAYSWCFSEGKPTLPKVEPAGKLLAFETLSGWSLKDNRRRRIETAISPGSVFQFKSAKNDETLALALAALELYAIGSYKPHGCGQLVVEKQR